MDTTRREFIGTVAAAVVGAPMLAQVHQPGEHVGFVSVLEPGYEKVVTYTEFGMSWEMVERPPFTRSHRKRLEREKRAIQRRKR